MAELEDIYEAYKKEVTDLDKKFVENIKKSNNPKKAEEDYRKNALDIRKKYYQKYEILLKQKTKTEISSLKNTDQRIKKKEEENKKDKETTSIQEPVLIIRPVDWKEAKKEETKLKKELKKFKKDIENKKFYRHYFPTWFFVLKIKIKIKIKEFFLLLKNLKEKIKTNTKEGISQIIAKSGEFLKTNYKNISETISKVLQKIKAWLSSKFKKAKKAEEKTEDQKIADRLMAKGSG
jgi:hypothetical protein